MDTDSSTLGHAYSADRERLLRRLRRAEGQVRGVARMVEEERYCIDVLTQISALQAALDKVALGVLGDHVRHCMVHGTAEARAERADELMAAIERRLR